jgi:putative colanic acid biosysnthesis UDP-glucose lipid carrier transferase
MHEIELNGHQNMLIDTKFQDYAPVDQLEQVVEPSFKRVLDTLFVVVLLPLLLPLLVVIAFAIKIDTPGPILFRQLRTGRGGKAFEILKFRTMTVDGCNSGFRQAQANDPRVTRVGAFLRKTSLDELPQLWNVLTGSMSLVGPRPHHADLDAWAMKGLPNYTQRWLARPGVTGWAQVKGLRGETRTMDDMKARVDADVWYAHNQSLWLDLKILIGTVWIVLSGRNAV